MGTITTEVNEATQAAIDQVRLAEAYLLSLSKLFANAETIQVKPTS